MSFAIGERPGPAFQGPATQVSRPAGDAPAARPGKDVYAREKRGAETPTWPGEPVNPPALKPYVDKARTIGFNTFLALGGVSFAGVVAGIVTCAFNPPLGLALIAGSALVNAGAVGTLILLAREDSVAEARRRPVVGAR